MQPFLAWYIMFRAPYDSKALPSDWREFLYRRGIKKTCLFGAQSISLGKVESFQWVRTAGSVLLMFKSKAFVVFLGDFERD